MIEIKVDYHYSGQRLDRLVRKKFESLPLSKIFSLFRKKKVRLNGVRAKGSEIINENDLIVIYESLDNLSEKENITAPTASHVASGWGSKREAPKANIFEILYEDDHYLILDKKVGISVQPGSGVPIGESLIEQVWNYLGESNKAQLAHRLDKGTSGVIAIGKDGPSIRNLTELIRSKKATKIYRCLVSGNLNTSGTIDLKLDRQDAAVGSKMQVGEGLESITHYESLKSNENYSLLNVILETGRMHQIRAHMNHIGHPLVGDDRYGNFEHNKKAKKDFKIKRMCLHAHKLELPGIGTFEAPIPEEFLNPFNT